MNTHILTSGKTYKIERHNYGGNTGNYGALVVKGDTVSVAVIGSQSRPAFQSEMVDLIPGSCLNYDTIVLAGIYTFAILPEYIRVTGTADAIEMVGYKAIEDLGDLPATPES
jgi:hypothetical protein